LTGVSEKFTMSAVLMRALLLGSLVLSPSFWHGALILLSFQVAVAATWLYGRRILQFHFYEYFCPAFLIQFILVAGGLPFQTAERSAYRQASTIG
jgi:hypothetical protein